MTGSASSTLNHAARILGALAADGRIDLTLRHYFGKHHYLCQREKRDITRALFAYHRWLQWLEPRGSAQKRLEEAREWQDRFDREPASIKPEALAARAVPDWVRAEMDPAPEYFRQLQREPALWLRARHGTAAALARSLGDCAPALAVPGLGSRVSALGSETQDPGPKTLNPSASGAAAATDALRYTGPKDLFLTEEFHRGDFEIQDLASQIVGCAASPTPGETWWDACAGEGGKTLHLAELMLNRGLIWASDRSQRRLANLKRRAARARVFNYRSAAWDGGPRLPTRTRFDGVLLDAPCSGVGTWQRNPQARWTTTPDDVRELAAVQAGLLDQVAPSLKPGGRLIYSVCTLTRSETISVVDAFTARHPEFEPIPVFSPDAKRRDEPAMGWETAGASPSSGHSPPPSAITLWPQDLNANGMFIAAWKRKK